MGVFEDLMLRTTGGFPGVPPIPIDPVEEAAQAEAAREAWAQKLRGGVRRTPTFGAPAVPFGSLGAGMFEGAPLDQAAVAPGEPPPAPPIEGPVPLPRDRPKEADGTTVDAPTDLSAVNQPPGPPLNIQPPAPVAPAPAVPVAAAAQPTTFGSLASGLMSGLKNNSATLLALGAGFAGAPNIGQGISRAAAAAIPASQADQKNRLLMQNQTQTLNALIAAKVPANMAMAALTNPEIMKAVSARYLETKPMQHVMVKDALGNETPHTFDPNLGVYKDMAGNVVKPDQSAVSAAGNVLAPGVKFDPNLTGQARFDQYSPEVQAAANAYMRGDVLPTGNPRAKSIETIAKRVAQQYGADMGIPVSDATFSEKRKYRTELGSTSATSAGGQAKAFNQGIEHAAGLADKLEQLGNWDPVGIPSVARGINWAREAFSTKQSNIAEDAKTLGQTLAGEVGKLFSGSAGGGVHERELTRNRFDTVKSPLELAGALAGTIETMEGGLKALEQRRDQIMGPNSDVKFVTKETEEKIAKIKEVIKRLKGEAPAAPVPAAGKTSGGVSWSVVQ